MSQKHFPSRPPHSPECLRLTLKEVSLAELLSGQPVGNNGREFQLVLFSQAATEWLETPSLTNLPIKAANTLILFKSVVYQSTRKGEVTFRMTQSALAQGGQVWIKNAYRSFEEARQPRYNYLSLMDAAEHKDRPGFYVYVYAVIQSVVKFPATTTNGNLHGSAVIVDQSCYDGMNKKQDYLLHIFICPKDKFPELEPGDVVRLHRVAVKSRQRDDKAEFRINAYKDMVVFPGEAGKELHTGAQGFTMGEEDFNTLTNLKAWSVQRFHQGPVAAPAVPVPRTLAVSLINFIF